jgi:hypothetical protein
MAYTAPNVLASGTTFAQFQAGGVSGHLEKLIAAQTGTPAPTAAPTGAASGSANTLAAGTYYAKFTETNGFGETTVSPESTLVTVTSGQLITWTFPALKSGNTARNLYMTPVNGASGTEVLYATGITTTTTTCAAPGPTNSFAVAPFSSTVAQTGFSTKGFEMVRGGEWQMLDRSYQRLRSIIATFNQGEPSTFPAVIQALRDCHAAFAVFSTLCSEMGTLIDANAGTLGTTATGIGTRKGVRTWP